MDGLRRGIVFSFLALSVLALTVRGAACPAQDASTQATSTHATEVPPGQIAVLTAEGRGVQIYRCDKPAADTPRWVFVAPEAQLYVNGAPVGTHGAGPMWSYQDGSVHGKVLASVPSPDAASVPWLLLQAVDPAGQGLLTRVTYIRRSDTKGGKAAADGCDNAHLGSLSRVPYTATYTFYAPAK